MPKKLGQILVERGALTPADLDDALEAQIAAGVRAGTALVQEKGFRLSQVCEGLAIQHNVPYPSPMALHDIDQEVLSLVPLELCLRHAVLPFATDGNAIFLAMRDPHRHVAGEIAFATKRPIKRFVVPELRIMYLLERHLSCQRAPRFLRDPTPIQSGDERRTHIAATFVTSPSEKPAGDPEVVTLDRAIEHNTEPASDLRAAIASVRPVDVTLARLRGASNAEAIIRRLVEPVVEGCISSILFFVRGDHAIACCAHGIETTAGRLQRLVVPLDGASLMQWAVRMIAVVRGIADPVQWEIASYFGVPPPGEVCVAPVVLRRKVVNLICVWSAETQTLGPDVAYVLGELAQGGARAYLELGARRRG
jgi:hypothetical protein